MARDVVTTAFAAKSGRWQPLPPRERPLDTLICRAGLFLRLSHRLLQRKHVGNHDAGGGEEDQRKNETAKRNDKHRAVQTGGPESFIDGMGAGGEHGTARKIITEFTGHDGPTAPT